jgi:hypothetical protein
MKLSIFYLTEDRRHHTFPHFIEMLNKSNKKDLWKLLILTSSHDSDFYKSEISNYEINNEVIYFDPNPEKDNNYINKSNYAIEYGEKHNIPYLMKCDNDIFLKSQTLDFIIDNLHLLENSNHLTLCPTLSSGIPAIEYFKDQFLDEFAQKEIEKLFLKTNMYDRDGVNYHILNKHTLHSNVWNKDDFFSTVKSINHFYKGVHPIRFNLENIQFINNYLIENKEKFFRDHELSIIDNDNSPYLCNSIFCIKRENYKQIINDKSLFEDGLDEVPLNKFAWKNEMNHLFIKNGFAIHMYYNWTHDHINKEIEFCNKFFN